jgi:hypothetical protein
MSSTSNKKLVDMIELLLSEVKDLKKIIKTHSIDLNIIKENSNLIQLKVSDLSCKVDLDISTLNITSKSSNRVKVDDKKTKLNIMSYFKLKYKTDPSSLDSIISKKEIDDLFKKYADELKSKGKKKDAETFKATLIYKEILKPSAEKTKLLRAMKETEESNNTIVDSEIIENIIDDSDVEEDED